jgi:hypothetical protein
MSRLTAILFQLSCLCLVQICYWDNKVFFVPFSSVVPAPLKRQLEEETRDNETEQEEDEEDVEMDFHVEDEVVEGVDQDVAAEMTVGSQSGERFISLVKFCALFSDVFMALIM